MKTSMSPIFFRPCCQHGGLIVVVGMLRHNGHSMLHGSACFSKFALRAFLAGKSRIDTGLESFRKLDSDVYQVSQSVICQRHISDKE